jgi:protein-tyrosine phosphatase
MSAGTPCRIDIHSHVLPGIDDGARDMVEALDMLRMARADGTSTIVATPHSARTDPRSIQLATSGLRRAASGAGVNITILCGAEVRFSADMAQDFREGKLPSIDDQGYVLVEFPFSQTWTSLINTSLYALQMAGALPVIAHAERYPAVQADPSILLELVATGIPVQVNSGSLLGTEGEQEQRTAELLLRAGAVHILASDGHRRDRRKPVMNDGFLRITELVGLDAARRIEQNANRILSGRTLNLAEPDRSILKPPSRLHRVFGRLQR